MKTESSTNSPTATLAPTKSQRDPVGLQATSTPSHLTGDLRTGYGFHGRKRTMRRYSPLLEEDNILLFYIKKAPLFKGKF